MFCPHNLASAAIGQPADVDETAESRRFQYRLQFEDFPAGPEYMGPAAELVMDDEYAKNYRTRLRRALSSRPAFAGEYVATIYGCGTCCSITTFVNKRTGRVLRSGFGGETGPFIVDAKVDSRLIIAEGPFFTGNGYDLGGCARYYFVLEEDKFGQRLRLIGTDLIVVPGESFSDESDMKCGPECGYWEPAWK